MKYLFILLFLLSCKSVPNAKYKINYLESSQIVYSNKYPTLREDMRVYIWKSYKYKLILDYKE